MSRTKSLWTWYKLEDLDQRGKVIAEYIWIDGSGLGIWSKQRTLTKRITSLKDLPEWNYDGSSTGQAETGNSEVVVKPVAFYPDPFRKGDNVLVLCEAFCVDWFKKTEVPANTNFRHFATEIMNLAKDSEPWFGIEQEYTLFSVETPHINNWPLGWP